MLDKIAGALPSTGAAGASSGASFQRALQGTGAPTTGAGLKAPAARPAAVQSKPNAGPLQAPKPEGIEPGSRLHLAPPHQAQVQGLNPGKVLNEVQRAQARLDSLLKMAESGRTFSPAELLAFQTHAYRASQELDLASKVVEKGTSAVKQTLQTQL